MENRKDIEYKCTQCGAIYSSKNKKKYDNNFCTKECENKFREKKIVKICETCGEEFSIIPSESKRRFCSMGCQSKWQSIYRVGENSPTYNHDISIKDRTLVCKYCGSEFITHTSYHIHIKKFCNMECSRKWYAEVWSQSKEWKDKSRIRGANMVKNIPKTMTKPHIRIDELLRLENISFENEKVFKYYSCDIFLTEYDLIIEIMGDYWHKHHRFFNIGNVCKKDKIKDSYIKNKYNIKILYLWESDIKNLDLCRNLIKEYIKNNGNLENYHSFNYNIEDGSLKLNKNIELPYMDRK